MILKVPLIVTVPVEAVVVFVAGAAVVVSSGWVEVAKNIRITLPLECKYKDQAKQKC